MMLDSVGNVLDDVGWIGKMKSGKSNTHPTKSEKIRQNEKSIQHKKGPYIKQSNFCNLVGCVG